MLRKFYMRIKRNLRKDSSTIRSYIKNKYEYWDDLSNLNEVEFLKLGYDLKQKNNSNYLGFRWNIGGHLPEKFQRSPKDH